MSDDGVIVTSFSDTLKADLAGIWESLTVRRREIRADSSVRVRGSASSKSSNVSSGQPSLLMLAEESTTAQVDHLEIDSPLAYRSIYTRLKARYARRRRSSNPRQRLVEEGQANNSSFAGFFRWAPSALKSAVFNLLACMACIDASRSPSVTEAGNHNHDCPSYSSSCGHCRSLTSNMDSEDSVPIAKSPSSSSGVGPRQSHRGPAAKQEVEDSNCNGSNSCSSTSFGPRQSHRNPAPKQEDAYQSSQSKDSKRVVPELRHLVLNMDINKTVLMTDSTNGKTPEQVVNETLANTSWGKEVDGEWILCVEEPSVLRPEPHLVSYVEWVESYHPGRENNEVRNKKNGTFSHLGRPGERMAPFARKLITSLRMPDGTEMRLIPSFFHLLLHLKNTGRSFCLCFRTFGLDLLDVAQELNMFCEGRHPLFPGVVMDGSDGQPDYRLHVEDIFRFGTFFRDRSSGDIALVMGTVEQPGEGQYRKEDPSLDFYERFPNVTVIHGNEAVQKWLWDKSLECGTLGIRDYFQYWKANGMTAQGGKPLFFAPYRSTKVHQIFFDDNIRYGDAYIVNAIDVREPTRFQWVTPLLETHLCRAEPLESIKDPKYFVKQLQRLEVGYERKLQARERLCRLLARVVRASKSQKALKKYESLQKGYRENGTTDQAENSSKDVIDLPKYDAWRDRRKASWLSSGEDGSVIENLVIRRSQNKSNEAD